MPGSIFFMLIRRLYALAFLCVTLAVGWYFLSGLFSTSGSEQFGTNQAAKLIRTEQQGAAKEYAVAYEIRYKEGTGRAPQQINVAFNRDALSKAVGFRTVLPASKVAELSTALQELEAQVFDERQRRLSEVEASLNATLSRNPESISLSINETGIVVNVHVMKKATKHGQSPDTDRIKDWAEQALAQYRPYILDITNDRNWMTPRLQKLNQALSPRYYSFDASSDFTRVGLLPNYAVIAQDSQLALYPLARALYDMTPSKEPRSLMQTVLDFIQAMPTDTNVYRQLGNRKQSSFKSPAECIKENKCDPDSKAVLMATLLSIVVPNTPIILTQTQRDAYIGVPVAARTDDITHEVSNIPYVLSDPSTSDIFPVGKVDDKAYGGSSVSEILKVTYIVGY